MTRQIRAVEALRINGTEEMQDALRSSFTCTNITHLLVYKLQQFA